MKVQMQILIFMVCINLTTGMVIELNLPGVSDITPQNPVNLTEYPEHFNSTEVADSWDSEPFSGIPVVGDIFSGFQFLFRNLAYLFVGFPLFLGWIGESFITDAGALSAYHTFTGVLIAVFSVMMSIFVIEFIAGRYTTT